MSLYVYSCPQCDEPVEIWHSILECDEERFCPFHAGQAVTRRIPNSFAFALKGANRADGWNGPTVREIQRKTEDSPEYKSGQLRPVGSRWV